MKLPSCKKITNEWNTFRIKKDKHKSLYAINYTKDTVFKWNIIFDSSAIYKTKDSLNQYDINKLIGLSDCGDNHRENSIRFGWRWLNDSLEIHWFKHENGGFMFDKMCTIELNKSYIYELNITNWDYNLKVNNVCVWVGRNCVKNKKRYFLYPYFGGNETAPHDISIEIKKGDH